EFQYFKHLIETGYLLYFNQTDINHLVQDITTQTEELQENLQIEFNNFSFGAGIQILNLILMIEYINELLPETHKIKYKLNNATYLLNSYQIFVEISNRIDLMLKA